MLTFRTLHRAALLSGALLAFCALSVLILDAAAQTPAPGAQANLPARGEQAKPPAGIQHVTSVEGIDELLLTSNGLRILLFPDPSQQTTTVNVTYLVGSRQEGYGETGMAHLLEHLMFKGSTHHQNPPDELTSHGCRSNGSTWFDRTNYFETFPATDENLAWALDFESDRMANSFIAQRDLDSEMSVVRNEFEIDENNSPEILEERVASTAYLWHNYGKSTIGSRSDIERVPIENLQAFYKKWYQPDNAILVIAGKFDRARALSLVSDTFGKIPRPTRVLPATYTVEPAQDGERSVTLRRVGDSAVVKLAYHIPAGSDPDFAAVEVLGQILGDTPSGRLYKALVETRMATGVSADTWQLHDPGLLILTAELRKDGPVDSVRDEMIRIAEGMGSAPPAADEVERAKGSLLNWWESSMRNSQRAAIGLSEWAAMGDWRLLFLHRDRLREVKPADVQRVAAAYLARDNRTAGVFLPTEKPERIEVPEAPDVAAMLQEYTGGEALAAGEEFDPTPENIEATVIRSTLPSGLKVVLLPKKTHGQAISFAMNLHFGDEASLKNQVFAGRLAGQMLMRGTQEHTRQQIQDALDAMTARLSIGRGGFGRRGRGAPAGVDVLPMNGECTAKNLPAFLQLVAEILEKPAFPADEFGLLKEDRLRRAEDSESDPMALGMNKLQRHLNPWPKDDVRYNATPEEQIAGLQAVTLDQVQAFYKNFYGASAGELALVGDFDPKQVEPLLQKLFGDWKSPQPYERLVSEYRDVPAMTERIETPDKESATMAAGERLNLSDTDPEYPALELANFMTGGGFLNSRLAVRIRQKEGFSYGVGSRLMASPFDKNGGFGVFAIYAPQNCDSLDRAFREEIDRVVASGFTAEEVAAAKSGWLQRRQVSRSNDRELAGILASRAYEGRDLHWDEDLESKIAALTPEEINQAVREYLDPSKLSVVHAGDFDKVKAEQSASEKQSDKSENLGGGK